MELREHLLTKFKDVDVGGAGLASPISSVIDYAIEVYIRDDENEIESFLKRKETAIKNNKIKKQDAKQILEGKNVLISRIVTEIFRKKSDRQYELYVSALEASSQLLEISRRPIDDNLSDEKWLTALKAKKQGWLDAKELIVESAKIAEDITGSADNDIEEHVEDTVYKSGTAETFAKISQEGRKK